MIQTLRVEIPDVQEGTDFEIPVPVLDEDGKEVDITDANCLMSIKLGTQVINIVGTAIGNIITFIIPHETEFSELAGDYEADYAKDGLVHRPQWGRIYIKKVIKRLLPEGEITVVTITNLSITSVAAIEEGETVQLTATATYSDYSTQDVSSQAVWSSSDELIVTVNNSGLATSSASGMVDISASFDGLSDSTSLTVTQAQAPITDQATLNGEELTLNGEPSTLTI